MAICGEHSPTKRAEILQAKQNGRHGNLVVCQGPGSRKGVGCIDEA